MIIVALISRGAGLYTLCKDLLVDFGRLELLAVDPCAPLPPADFFIWDYSPDTNFPEIANFKVDHHLILVDRENLSSAADHFPDGVLLLIKPFEKAALSKWLSRMLGYAYSAADASSVACVEREAERCDLLAKGLHDFGAPLTAASGYCELLLAEEFGAFTIRQKDILGRMRNSLARLARMTSEMFERTARTRSPAERPPSGEGSVHAKVVSEIPMAGRRTPKVGVQDVEQCVKQAIHEIELVATAKRLRVISRITPSEGAMYLDPSQLEQVLANLLDNACKFTQVGGVIEVNGYPQPSERRISLRNNIDSVCVLSGCNSFRIDVFNTGPTIARERLERIFEDYVSFDLNAGEKQPIRCEETGSSGRPGAGLGLGICRSIIERHHGQIWAENRLAGPVISFLVPLEASGESPIIDGAPDGVQQRHPYSGEVWAAAQPHAG